MSRRAPLRMSAGWRATFAAGREIVDEGREKILAAHLGRT